MKYFAIYDKNDLVVKNVIACSIDELKSNLKQNDLYIEVDSLHSTGYIDDGILNQYPSEQPNTYFKFDVSSKSWILAIDNNELSLIEREKRNLEISKSDWTQLPDVPEETRLKWKAYRQALRDITLQDGFPQNIIWPEMPE